MARDLNCTFQCPQCGTVWSPARHELLERVAHLRTVQARAQKRYEDFLKQNESEIKDRYTYNARHSDLKNDLYQANLAVRALTQELRGDPIQIWQTRYSKALEIAKSMMTPNMFNQFQSRLDEACRPKIK